jgi:alkanesulfonate monooxygenase SsuD/methylene tetrahydromethanopterin reductase-like flavin-dependent oxidoreductase (luciferase family)
MKVSMITSIPWLDSSSSHEEVYREAVEQVRLADELGFDCAWFTEHHFGTHGINGAVLPFAAYIAGVTRRIRIGTAVVVAPLYHPMRLAEEVAEVDLLSGGRLELGIGSGYRSDEFRGYNVAPAESRARFHEIIEVLLKAWKGAPFGHDGTFYKVPDGIAVRPVPRQKPHPPIWVAAFSPATVEWVARSGFHLMTASTGPSIVQIERMREHFDAELAKGGRNPGNAEFYIHIPLHLTDKPYHELKTELGGRLARFSAAATTGGTIYDKVGAETGITAHKFNFDDYYENHALIGPAADCLRKLEQWWTKLKFTHLTCAFGLGIPHSAVLSNMELFARDLMPTLRTIDGNA